MVVERGAENRGGWRKVKGKRMLEESWMLVMEPPMYVRALNIFVRGSAPFIMILVHWSVSDLWVAFSICMSSST